MISKNFDPCCSIDFFIKNSRVSYRLYLWDWDIHIEATKSEYFLSSFIWAHLIILHVNALCRMDWPWYVLDLPPSIWPRVGPGLSPVLVEADPGLSSGWGDGWPGEDVHPGVLAHEDAPPSVPPVANLRLGPVKHDVLGTRGGGRAGVQVSSGGREGHWRRSSYDKNK